MAKVAKVSNRGSKPGERRGGRKKGTPNRTTRQVKEALTLAFEGIGGVPHLKVWAEENPTEFYKLWAKLLPQEVSGPDGGEIPVKHSGTIDWGGVKVPL